MNKEELIEFLRENLSISVEERSAGCTCCGESEQKSYEIKLMLGEEVISENYIG